MSEGGADSVLLYQTEDGLVQLQVRLEDDTVWLSQAQLGALLDTSKQNIGQLVVKDSFTTASPVCASRGGTDERALQSAFSSE